MSLLQRGCCYRFEGLAPLTGPCRRVYLLLMTTPSLRAELERVVIEHFDPSVMARAQAVDELLEVVTNHIVRLRAMTDAAAQSGQGVIGTHTMGQVTIHVDHSPPPNAVVDIVEDIRRASLSARTRGSW